MTVSRWFLVSFGLIGMWLAAGCRGGNAEPGAAEVDEPYFRQGQRQVKQERTQEALASFLKVIEQRGEKSSPESHLEAGLIYLKHSKDPIEAYHHFRQYLAQQGPNSQQAARVAELILTAKKEFAKTLPGQPLENAAQRMDYLEQLEKLQRENQELKAEIAALHNGANSMVMKTVRGPANAEVPPIRANTPATVPVMPMDDDSPMKLAPMPNRPPVMDALPSLTNASRPNSGGRAPPLRPGATVAPTTGRRHTVAPSESLYGIARKYYGTATAAKTREIFEANRDVMKSLDDLHPGMELKIP